ncbi:Hypothetical protein PFR_JS8_1937 [Propionibacterium freudenreichii]|nr:Hypothetical protein PFR_JS8_1937 [Propionibacterium freudenreichii]
MPAPSLNEGPLQKEGQLQRLLGFWLMWHLPQ